MAWVKTCHENKSYLQSSLWAERATGGEKGNLKGILLLRR